MGHMELFVLYHHEANLYKKPQKLRMEVVNLLTFDVLLMRFKDPEEVLNLGGIVFPCRNGSEFLDTNLLEHMHEEDEATVAECLSLYLLDGYYNPRLKVFEVGQQNEQSTFPLDLREVFVENFQHIEGSFD